MDGAAVMSNRTGGRKVKSWPAVARHRMAGRGEPCPDLAPPAAGHGSNEVPPPQALGLAGVIPASEQCVRSSQEGRSREAVLAGLGLHAAQGALLLVQLCTGTPSSSHFLALL